MKRDVRLLGRVFPEPGDSVTVLDVSLDSNRADLVRILDAGVSVAYFDHHFSGDVPEHELFAPHLDGSKDVCTSLLVDEFLGGAHRRWAVVGACGDNLDAAAERVGASSLNAGEREPLRELGRLLNYNSYGRTLEDLHFAPDRLYRMVHPYRDPLDFIASEPAFRTLKEGHAADMAKAADLKPEMESARACVYILPDEAWARRVSGVLANALSRRRPDVSHALVVPNSSACLLVSVRVAENSSRRADEFCRQFESGGGRAGAAGINHLPRRNLDAFLRTFEDWFS